MRPGGRQERRYRGLELKLAAADQAADAEALLVERRFLLAVWRFLDRHAGALERRAGVRRLAGEWARRRGRGGLGRRRGRESMSGPPRAAWRAA